MSTAIGQRKLEKIDKSREKNKAGGKGTKTTSPVLDGPIESDTSRPLDSEEIQALAIRLEELEKLHPDKNERKSFEEHQKSFIVKKTKSGPQKQPIQVAKIAPQQPVQEQLISSGIRFDTTGGLLPYSILGTANDYVAELPDNESFELRTATGDNKKYGEDVPEVKKYEKKSKRPSGSPDGGGRSLHNWKFRMEERRQVMNNMSKELKRSPATLLMNQTDRWRERKELLDLMDATLPLIENGKNWRLHSEFWTQQLLIGDDDKGIHTTLTRTEMGLPPPFEKIGKPTVGLLETGLELSDKKPKALHKRQWFNSEYLEQRLDQLNPYLQEIVPHQADLSSLQIIGHQAMRRKSQQKSDVEVHVREKSKEYETVITDNIQLTEDYKDNENAGDSFNYIPDIADSTIMGPALKIDTFVFQQMPNVNENEELDFIYEIRVQFDSQVCESVTRTVDIKNVGTTVFYYDWQLKPYTKPFDIVNSKTQRFYFDNRTKPVFQRYEIPFRSHGSILPNDTLKLSFVFKSNEPGIFTERWQLLTRPVLCGGRPIIFTLRGVTTEEDIHRQTRIDIEQMLLHKEAESIVRKIVSGILDDVRTPERARSPIDFYMTEQDQFQENNPDLYFDYEIFEQLKKLYEQVVPEYAERKWDLSVETLRNQILSFDEDNPNKQTFLEQLNQAVNQLTLQPIVPSEQITYLACYDIVNQFIDSFVDTMGVVYNKLEIEEPSTESYPDVDLNGYEFESWKKFFEFTKQQETEKRVKSAAVAPSKDKKATPGKAERGKSPKRSPAPSQAPSAVGSKRGPVSGNASQMSKRPSFVSPAKPDKEHVPLTPQQLEERFKITQESYLPVYSLLCQTMDRLQLALDDLSEKSSENNPNMYAQLASSIQNQSLNVLDILKDELTRNLTSIDVNNFF